MRFLRMKPGHGEVLIAEGDPEIVEDEERLGGGVRTQLEAGAWAGGPRAGPAGQRRALVVRSCVNDEEWAMYRDLGFIRVWGSQADGPSDANGIGGAAYAYLIYPHRPIVAYLAQTDRLLGEYCIAFPDETRPYGSARLPDSDDVLAKWMALTGDERRLIAAANMHLVGRQLDPDQVRRDLWRLSQWERSWMRTAAAQTTATEERPRS